MEIVDKLAADEFDGFRRIVPPSWWSVSKPLSALVAVDVLEMAEEDDESTSLRQQLLSSVLRDSHKNS